MLEIEYFWNIVVHPCKLKHANFQMMVTCVS